MKISQLRSSEEDRPPRKDSWSTLTDIEKMKERDTLMGKEMVSKTEKEIEGQRRFSEPASNKDAETVEKKHEPGPSPRINVCYRKYTIEQIEKATEYFSSSQKIDEGGYGPVYKATLDHTSVAIKVLRPDVSQGLKQFNQEVIRTETKIACFLQMRLCSIPTDVPVPSMLSTSSWNEWKLCASGVVFRTYNALH